MTFEPTNTIATLMLIAQDMADDARNFDGKPLDGKAVGEQFGNQGAAVARIAEIVGALCTQVDALEQRLKAVMEQQGLETRKRVKLEAEVRQITAERPKPFQDFLPEGEEHFHTGDDGPCWGADCFTAVASVDADQAVQCGAPQSPDCTNTATHYVGFKSAVAGIRYGEEFHPATTYRRVCFSCLDGIPDLLESTPLKVGE